MTSTEYTEQNPEVSYAKAWSIVREHDVSENEFLLAFGMKDSYDTAMILEWLGY